MDSTASAIIDQLGGTTAVARMTDAPVTTVHSWRKNGIPASRLAHLKLAAAAAKKVVNWSPAATPTPDMQQVA